MRAKQENTPLFLILSEEDQKTIDFNGCPMSLNAHDISCLIVTEQQYSDKLFLLALQ